MKRIFKYPIVGMQLELPRGAKVLHVDLQDGKPMCWAEVDAQEKGTEVYGVLPTGAELANDDLHVGTWQTGEYVWHLYRMPMFDR